MTKAQQGVLNYIGGYTANNGYAPTFREVAAAMGWSSPSTAADILERLRDRGLVAWKPGSPRTLRVLSPGGSS